MYRRREKTLAVRLVASFSSISSESMTGETISG